MKMKQGEKPPNEKPPETPEPEEVVEEAPEEIPEVEMKPVDFTTMGKDAFPEFLKEWNQFKKDFGWTPGKPPSTFAKVLAPAIPAQNGGTQKGSFNPLRELEEFWGP
jgi:hypothetical protein